MTFIFFRLDLRLASEPMPRTVFQLVMAIFRYLYFVFFFFSKLCSGDHVTPVDSLKENG